MKIAQERRQYSVFPKKEELFKAFHLTSFDDIRAVIVGMDPFSNRYKGEPVAHGLAFSPRNPEYLPPSLKQIYNQIVNSFYTNEETDYRQMNLEEWAKQGVFLLNTALTVREGEAGSHLKDWQWFTTGVIKKINELSTGVVFCLWGKEAQKLETYIESHNIILKAPHPVSASYTGQSWKCNHFEYISKHLKDLNGTEFQWLQNKVSPYQPQQ